MSDSDSDDSIWFRPKRSPISVEEAKTTLKKYLPRQIDYRHSSISRFGETLEMSYNAAFDEPGEYVGHHGESSALSYKTVSNEQIEKNTFNDKTSELSYNMASDEYVGHNGATPELSYSTAFNEHVGPNGAFPELSYRTASEEQVRTVAHDGTTSQISYCTAFDDQVGKTDIDVVCSDFSYSTAFSEQVEHARYNEANSELSYTADSGGEVANYSIITVSDDSSLDADGTESPVDNMKQASISASSPDIKQELIDFDDSAINTRLISLTLADHYTFDKTTVQQVKESNHCTKNVYEDPDIYEPNSSCFEEPIAISEGITCNTATLEDQQVRKNHHCAKKVHEVPAINVSISSCFEEPHRILEGINCNPDDSMSTLEDQQVKENNNCAKKVYEVPSINVSNSSHFEGPHTILEGNNYSPRDSISTLEDVQSRNSSFENIHESEDSLSFNDTLEEMNRFLAQGADYKMPEKAHSTEKVKPPSFEVQRAKTTEKSKFTYSESKIKPPSINSKSLFGGGESASNTKFKQPSKPPKTLTPSKIRNPFLKNIVSPIGEYIKQSPKYVPMIKVHQSKHHPPISTKQSQLSAKENVLSKHIPRYIPKEKRPDINKPAPPLKSSEFKLPPVIYKSAKNEIVLDKREMKLPGNIRKFIKPKVLTTHDGRVGGDVNESIERRLMESDFSIDSSGTDASLLTYHHPF